MINLNSDQAADSVNETVKRRYNRISRVYDFNPMDVPEKLRRAVVDQAKGRVLEVGVGTGKNLPFYPANVEVTGIDISPKMLARAKRRVEQLGVHNVTLVEMDAQRLTFPDQSFDTVISTCVFCTVPNPVVGLKEIKRVLKPNGHLYMLEHMRSARPGMGFFMDIFDPLIYAIVGTHINRRTLENIAAAGLTISDLTAVASDIMFKITIKR